MDPITLALISLGIQVGGSILDNIFFNLDIFGEKTAQEKQEALVREQAGLQLDQIGAAGEQLEAERAATEVSFQEQQDIFEQQTQSFLGAQRNVISMAGVALTQGSPLLAQQQSIENIARDKEALTRNQEVSLSQFDVAQQDLLTQEAGVNTAYQQYLLELEQRDRDRRNRPIKTLIGGLSNSPIASLLGTKLGNQPPVPAASTGFAPISRNPFDIFRS